MIKFFAKKINNKKGFTLIELLIVIAVLGILAALAAPRFLGVADTFKEKTDIESANILRREAETLVMSGAYDTDGVVPVANLGGKYPKAQAKGHATDYIMPVISEETGDKDKGVKTITMQYGTWDGSAAAGSATGVVSSKVEVIKVPVFSK